MVVASIADKMDGKLTNLVSEELKKLDEDLQSFSGLIESNLGKFIRPFPTLPTFGFQF